MQTLIKTLLAKSIQRKQFFINFFSNAYFKLIINFNKLNKHYEKKQQNLQMSGNVNNNLAYA